MTLLIIGVALWWAAHLFKRVAPSAREAMGQSGKGLIALLILLSVVLMVMGYRGAEGAYFWGRTPALVGINNLLMMLAFYLYAAGAPKDVRIWIGTKLRHPQLTGFSVWTIAHLVVNGDTPSFILFGGLLIWAVVEIRLINAAEPAWTPLPRAAPKREIIAVVITVGIVAVVMAVHNWLGVQPWG